SFFHGHDQGQFLDGPKQRVAIDRFGEAGVDNTDVQPLGPQTLGRLNAIREQRAVGDKYTVRAPLVDFSPAMLDWRRSPIDSHQVGLGITNGDWPVMFE